MTPLLITSSIISSAPKTVLNSADERLRETIKGVTEWGKLAATDKIVICDGSGFDLTPHIERARINSSCQIEVIRFSNDVGRIARQGKGWGEGEIIKYALRESVFLRNADAFMKCTGKLWVTNAAACLKKFNGNAAFDFEGRLRPNKIDTRFYISKRHFYEKYLSEAHEYVNDVGGYYLEHAFKKALEKIPMAQYVMIPTPRVMGVSGSMGISYEQSYLKRAARDIRSMLARAL